MQPYYQPGPPRPSRRRRTLLIIGVVTVAALLLFAGGTVVALRVLTALPFLPRPAPTGEAGGNEADAVAEAQLADAVARTAGLPGVRYKGKMGDGTSVDITVSHGGSSRGTMTVGDDKVQFLVVDGKTFIKAKAKLWRSSGASPESVEKFAKSWVQVPKNRFPLHPIGTPQAFAKDMARARVVGVPTTVGGVPARRIVSPSGNVYMSTSEPPRLLRIELGGGVLDLVPLDGDQLEDFLDGLKKDVRGLKKAVNSQVRFNARSAARLSPCNNFGCTAHVTISNSLTVPQGASRARITADITISFALDGRPVGSCTRSVSMRANGQATVSCGVTYSARTDRNHTVRAVARGLARAVVAADLRRMADGLDKERDESPAACDLASSLFDGPVTAPAAFTLHDPRPAERCGYKGKLKDENLPVSGKVRYIPRPDYPLSRVRSEGLPKGPNGRGFRDKFDNVWVKGPARSRRALSKGATWEWDVQLTKENRRRYRWLCEQERKKNITHLNVTPDGEISHVVCE
ncbi:hypothetical protein Nocox_38695 [Nonomuraea coxensis DSM 45129]|uniref:Novel toxin 17 domain-containing protein n=1 Tax=Nonomuraea coxensis DSM 45129 TaxID=1122611 RepID=A0ABX8UBZ9_9ACTN|nr:polymorphic toxin type 17 domain-containing protein [Nonomuraea coxensis]QYC45289.1 hypothetical protein Nocox_38695 [Nonomuraea coxensis DSM 45129]